MALRVFTIASDRGPVGSGVSGARFVLLPAVLKLHDPGHHFVANEYIANGIGRFLGLPLPPGSINDAGGTLAYSSLNFNITNETLPPLDPQDCYGKLPDDSTGLVMFDILIANPDRHNANVSAVLHEKPFQMIAFDHGHALLGYQKVEALTRLAALQDRLGISGGTVTKQNRHCLIDCITGDAFFSKWADRIASLPDHFIDGLCEDMRDQHLMDFSECGALKAFIKHRRDNFGRLIADNKSEFTGVTQWGLNL